MARINHQSGAVSLFAVIFAAILLSIVTVSFIKLMINDQKQATDNDLSQSAYDAALAGVEDAKRVIRASQLGNATATDALARPNDCKVIKRSGVLGADASDEETVIRSNTSTGGGGQFDQAYTCVNIDMKTPDFLYEAIENTTQVIPLRAADTFNKIRIQWYTRDNNNNQALVTGGGVNDNLPTLSEWPTNAPPIVRAQVITPGAEFSIDDLDKDAASRTVFLKPGSVNTQTLGHSIDTTSLKRATDQTQGHSGNSAHVVACNKNFAYDDLYSCQVTLDITAVSAADSVNAFLRLNTIYKGAHVRVSLLRDSEIIYFDGVQPSVDSTGRAANVFRRVEARLQIGDDFAYPENAVELVNSLCKDFSLVGEEVIAGGCKP